ncbi:MAG TPA: AAA family ATPase [Rubrobacter sp.]
MIPEAKPLSVRLLGLPEVSFEGRSLRPRRKKALALLCYLATEEGPRHRRELAELFWPESEERPARTDLRSILSKLRKALGEDDTSEGVHLLAIDGDLLGVEPQGVELDLRGLEAAVSLARREVSGTPPGGDSAEDAAGRRDATARLEDALGIYRGEFMEGFTLEDAPEFELWLEAERARWRALFGELCEGVSRLQAGAGRLEEATGTSRLWTTHAPLEEAAHRRLVELLSSTGDGEGALVAYEGFRRALARELGIEPSPQMRELADRMREEVEQRAPLGASLAHSAAAGPLSALDVPFAGRGEVFGALVSEYHAALAGEARVVAVLGEGGIGKTRLVEEFLPWAKARGADVLQGAASEEARLSYGPLVEAIRPRVERERAPDDLLEDAWLSELSRLLPELKERYPDLPPPLSGEGETTKAGLFEAIARAVGALASRAPVVLFLDDLQWADAATLEVLGYAGRRWTEQGAPVLLLIAARPEEPEAGSSFASWFSSLERRLPARSLTLGPLEAEDVDRLLRILAGVGLDSAAPPENPGVPDSLRSEFESFGDRLAAETGGQPFYLVETLKALLEEGKLVARARPDGGVIVGVSPALRAGGEASSLLPQSVREVIMSRLSRLSPVGSDLLAAGAVLGRGFGFDRVLAVAGLEEAEGLRGLDELTERRILREDGDGKGRASLLQHGATYSFSHEKIRQVAYTGAGQARRRVLHRRAFETLEERGAPPAELARHALAAGLAGPSFAYSVAAGDNAAEVFALRDAVVHYEWARDASGAGGWPSGAFEPSIDNLEYLYIQLGQAYEVADEWEKARASYETVRALGRELREARLEVVALNHLAILSFNQEADLPRARALLGEASRAAEEAGLPEALAETECNLSDVMSFWAGELELSRLLAAKTLALTRGLDRPDLVARALETLTRQEMLTGRLEEAAAHAEEGAALSRRLAERPAQRTQLPPMLAIVRGVTASWKAVTKTMEIQCLIYLAYVRVFQGKLQEGIAIGREVLGKSRQLPEQAETMGSAALSLGLLASGEYEEVLEITRRGTEMARNTLNPLSLWINLDQRGRAYEALLDLEKARRVHEEALELRGDVGPHYEAISSSSLCAVAALSENWEEAHAHARRAHEVGTSFHLLLGIYLHHEVEALLRAGDGRFAREEMRRFSERARTNERDRIAYLRTLAVLSEWKGDGKSALGHLHDAEALAEKIGLPGELWQIRAKIGEICERRGEANEAHEAFSRAAQTLKTLAQKIADEELKKGFLSAPRARRVLWHD